MKPKMIMMVGLPGSGKSTFAKEYAEENDCIVISSDDMRELYFGDVNDQSNNKELFEVIHSAIKSHLRCKQSVVFDATNIDSKKRKAFLDSIAFIECEKYCVVCATPYEVCLNNNKYRDRNVPEDVIKRMYTHFQMPHVFEGFDAIYVDYSDPNYKTLYGDPMAKAVELKTFDQFNHHHSMTLGEHLIDVYNNVYPFTEVTHAAALLHDVGKVFTQVFTDAKGNSTIEAHYYNHANVSAYDSLFYNTNANKIEIAAIITYHMYPHNWEKEETKEKYKKLWGNDLYKAVMTIHEADTKGH